MARCTASSRTHVQGLGSVKYLRGAFLLCIFCQQTATMAQFTPPPPPTSENPADCCLDCDCAVAYECSACSQLDNVRECVCNIKIWVVATLVILGTITFILWFLLLCCLLPSTTRLCWGKRDPPLRLFLRQRGFMIRYASVSLYCRRATIFPSRPCAATA